jgi:hypothetical protein
MSEDHVTPQCENTYLAMLGANEAATYRYDA